MGGYFNEKTESYVCFTYNAIAAGMSGMGSCPSRKVHQHNFRYTKGITLRVYQISCNSNTKQFSIKEMADAGTIFKYNMTTMYQLMGYNGFNRVPGADVLAGDFDGDGETEIAVLFFGDFPTKRSSRKPVMITAVKGQSL